MRPGKQLPSGTSPDGCFEKTDIFTLNGIEKKFEMDILQNDRKVQFCLFFRFQFIKKNNKIT